MSDSERKAAEEYALASGWSCLDEQLAGAEAFAIRDAYLAGRSSALKDLEQVAREASDAAVRKFFDEISCNQVYPAKKSEKSCVIFDSIVDIRDRLLSGQKKTESKETGND